MGELMIRCPKTGKPDSTGVYMDRKRFRSMPVFSGAWSCCWQATWINTQ